MLNARVTAVIGAASAITDDGRQWIEVIPTCTEARNGPWMFTITAADLETYAQSIRDSNGLIPIDYDHDGADGGSTVAAGWFTGQAKVEDREGEPVLLAEVKWTPQATQEIRDGRFKRISPEFDFHEVDAKTGLLTRAKEILAATLTNRPFFRQLAALAADATDPAVVALALRLGVDPDDVVALAADEEPADETLVQIKEKIHAALGGAGDDSGRAAKEDEMELSAIAAALGLPEDTDEATILAKAKEAKDAADAKRRRPGNAKAADVAVFAEALGLSPDADEATVLAAVRKAATDSDRVSTLEQDHESLTATARDKQVLELRVKAIEAERRQERIDRILTDAVRDGQMIPAEKSAFARAFAENPDGLLEIINARPKRSFAPAGSGEGGSMEDSEAVRATRQTFESAEADGVDGDSARLHVRAEQWLAERGKKSGTYTAEEYAQACDSVALERVY